jgi:hypothetical protein
MPIALAILSVLVVPVVPVWEPFSCFFFGCDHPFYRASEFFVIPWIFFTKVLKLPSGDDSIGKSFDYFSFCDVVYLSA